MNIRSICAGLLLLMLLAGCGSAPATPLAPPATAPVSAQLIPMATTPPTAVPTTAPVSAQQIPVATSTTAPASAQEPAVQPTPQKAAPTTAAMVAPASSAIEGPALIAPSADGLQMISAAGQHLQTFDQAQVSLGRQSE